MIWCHGDHHRKLCWEVSWIRLASSKFAPKNNASNGDPQHRYFESSKCDVTVAWRTCQFARSLVTYITRGAHRTHTPRGMSSAATIDVNSMPMRIERYRVYCVRAWPYPRCGSDRLPCIQQLSDCEAEKVGPNVTK